MKENDELKDMAIEYGIEIAKTLALTFISSKFSKNKSIEKEIVITENKVIEKPKKKKKGLIKKLVLGYVFKEVVFDRLQAKLTHKPDTKDYSWLFDYPTGKNLIDMNAMVNEISSEDQIIDLGCGLGYFSIETAKKATKGKTYAVDENLDSLKILQDSAHNIGIANIEIHRAYIEKLPFPIETFDKAYLNMTIGQLADKPKALTEIRRVLKTSGKLYITDILLDDYYCLSSTIIEIANSCGFKVLSEKGNFFGYTLTLQK